MSIICPRCKRAVRPWPLRRADVCSPPGWSLCIRNISPISPLAKGKNSPDFEAHIKWTNWLRNFRVAVKIIRSLRKSGFGRIEIRDCPSKNKWPPFGKRSKRSKEDLHDTIIKGWREKR